MLLRSSTLILQVSDIVEVMTSVLDNEEDEDGHLSCLLITQDLLCKDSEGLFLEQFAKLGLFSKVRKKEYTVTIFHQIPNTRNQNTFLSVFKWFDHVLVVPFEYCKTIKHIFFRFSVHHATTGLF